MSLLKRLDRNGDQRLSPEEIPPRMAERLKRLDLNQDGSVDVSEVREMAARMPRRRQQGNKAPQQRPKAATDTPNKRPPGDRRAKPDPQVLAGMMRRLDKNGDQVISPDEVPERMQRAWERLDRNGNNLLEAAELKQLASFLERRGEPGKAKKKTNNERDAAPRSRGGVKPKRPGGDG